MRYIKLARIKMAYTGIFVLIFVIIAIHKVQSECSSADCNSDVCSDVCKTWSLDGTCVENECRCSTDKKCIDFVCDKVCEILKANVMKMVCAFANLNWKFVRYSNAKSHA